MEGRARRGHAPRNANCAQKSTTPKNGKLAVMRLMKVLATLGVHTSCAASLVAVSAHGRIAPLSAAQSGCSPGWRGARSQYACGPKVA